MDNLQSLHYNAYYWISNICHEGRSSKTKLKKVVQKWWVFSIYFLVQTFPCDSKPCLNGAICANDVKDIAKYHCKCTSDYSGVNCQGKLRNTHVLFLLKRSYTSKMIFFYKTTWKFTNINYSIFSELNKEFPVICLVERFLIWPEAIIGLWLLICRFIKFSTWDNAILAFWLVHCISVTSDYTYVWPYMEVNAAKVAEWEAKFRRQTKWIKKNSVSHKKV